METRFVAAQRQRRRVAIQGLVAAGELCPDSAAAKGKRRITYDRIYDPTDSANYGRNYRIMAREGWRSYVP